MKVDQSCPTFLRPHGLYSPWNSPGQNPGVGSCSLLQGIFPTQGSNRGGSNPRLPHCRRILHQLSHKGSPRILKWVAFPFSIFPTQGRSPTSQVDSLPTESPGKSKSTGVGSLSLLQGIFPTLGIKPRSPALQADSSPAEPQGKPKSTGEGSLSFL